MKHLKTALQTSLLIAFLQQCRIVYEQSQIYIMTQEFFTKIKVAFFYSFFVRLASNEVLVNKSIFQESACFNFFNKIYRKFAEINFPGLYETSILISLLKNIKIWLFSNLPLGNWKRTSCVVSYLDNHCNI